MKFKTPEEAAYMARKFTVRVLIENPDWEGEREDAYIWSSNPLAIVNNWFDGDIHEDDYHIFKPQEFDRVRDRNGSSLLWTDWVLNEISPDDVTIFERDDILFFHPKVNNDTAKS